VARTPLTRESAVVLRRRVGACLGFRVLASANFVWPVLLPFAMSFAELSPAGALWLVAAYLLGALAAERPAVGLAARLGRRPVLIGAGAASAGGCALVLVGTDPATFAAGQFLLGVAAAARDAGAPDLLAATLADFGQDDDAPLVERRARLLENGVAIGTAALSGVLLQSWWTGPYVFTLVTSAGALVCAGLLDEPRRPARKPARGEVATATRELSRAPALARAILFGAIAAGLSVAVRFGQQAYLLAIGLPLVWLGILAALAEGLRVASRDAGGGVLRERRLTGPVAWIGAAWLPLVAMAALRHGAILGLTPLRGAGDGTRARDLGSALDGLVAPAFRPAAGAVVSLAERCGALAAAVVLAAAAPLGLAGGLGLLAIAAVVLTCLAAWAPLPRPQRVEDRFDVVVSPGASPPSDREAD
jgi:MFS family permease